MALPTLFTLLTTGSVMGMITYERDCTILPTPTPTSTPTPTPTPTPEPTVTPTPEPQCIRNGDVNGDTVLTAGDAQLAFQIALGVISPTYEEACAADCNNDGVVTAGDAQLIFLGALGLGQCADPVAG